MAIILPAFSKVLRRQAIEHQPKFISAIGFMILLAFAFSRSSSYEFGKTALEIVGCLGLLCIYKYGKAANSAPLFILVLLSILVQSIPWALSHLTHPEWAVKNLEVDYLTRWFIFIPLAWWVAQYKHGIWLLYLAAAASILLSPWLAGYGTQEIIDGLQGKRVDFNLENAQHTSLFFGIVALGLICFTPRIYRTKKYLVLFSTSAIALSLCAVLISASRQSWLALLVTFAVFTLFFIIKLYKSSLHPNTTKAIVLLLTLCAGLVYTVAKSDYVLNRVMTEKTAISKILSTDFDNVPYSSFGIRLHSWVAATDFIEEKPTFGWGSNGMTLVIKKTEWLPDFVRKQFGHLHNSYIEIVVNFGIIGLIFYLSAWVYLTKKVLQHIRNKELPADIGYFYFSFLCFWSVMICFEAYQNYWTGTLCLQVILAGVFGKIWHKKLNISPNNYPK